MWKLKIAERGNDPYVYSTNNYVGRQIWEFEREAGTPQDRYEVEQARRHFFNNRFKVRVDSDLLWRMQFLKEKRFEQTIAPVKVEAAEDITHEKATAAMRRAAHYYSALQASDGHWPAEQSGCSFYMPPLLICLYITGHLNTIITVEHRREILRYIYCHQNEDGGWGTHITGHSSMFGTTLSYIAMRILGEGPDDGEDNACARARQWILDRDGATSVPSWGKIWLSIFGVLDWSCTHPMPPEFWLLPDFIPLHPDQMLSYCRITYEAMSYLYGKRFVGPITPLVLELRNELLLQPYDSIKWTAFRHVCAKEDLYYPCGMVQRLMWDALYTLTEPVLNRWPLNKLIRARALEKLEKHIHYEDETSRYIAVGCVEKPLFMLCCWAEDPNSDHVKKHAARVVDYFWVGEDGMKMQSIGSQTWDTSFALQAMVATNLFDSQNDEDRAMMERTLERGHFFLKESQVRDELPGDYRSMYRHTSKGSWTFSDKDHGLAISDGTAEALTCCLLLSTMAPEIVGHHIEPERLYDAVNVILYTQSKNGGVTAWEPAGTQKWMEILNPVEFLAGIVVETEYVECTSSAIHALILFKKMYPRHRKEEIENSIANAAHYIESIQKGDGSWFGNWGLCFTYGTWFAIRGLIDAGKTYSNCKAVRRGVDFLLRTQRANGGWGESQRSYPEKLYVPLEDNRSNLVQTSWALLALILSRQEDRDPKPIHQGVKLLINSQKENGDFPHEDMLGTFMKNCMVHYAAYNNIFPLWAIAEYCNRVLSNTI